MGKESGYVAGEKEPLKNKEKGNVLESKREGKNEEMQSIQAENAIHELKMKWSTAFPWLMTSFLGGSENANANRVLGDDTLQSPHFEETNALQGKVTYKVITRS